MLSDRVTIITVKSGMVTFITTLQAAACFGNLNLFHPFKTKKGFELHVWEDFRCFQQCIFSLQMCSPFQDHLLSALLGHYYLETNPVFLLDETFSFEMWSWHPFMVYTDLNFQRYTHPQFEKMGIKYVWCKQFLTITTVHVTLIYSPIFLTAHCMLEYTLSLHCTHFLLIYSCKHNSRHPNRLEGNGLP